MQIAVLIFMGFPTKASLQRSDRPLNLFSIVAIFSIKFSAPSLYNTCAVYKLKNSCRNYKPAYGLVIPHHIYRYLAPSDFHSTFHVVINFRTKIKLGDLVYVTA